MIYAFTVTGPQDGVLVPMHVKAFLETDATGTGDAVNASARFTLVPSLFGGQYVAYNILREASATGPNLNKGFTGTLPFDHVSGAIGTVHLNVHVTALDRNGGGIATGTADPFIFIDPVWLSTHPGYSVSVSEGVGNIDPDAPPDSTPPLIEPNVGGTLGNNDWYTSDVLVDWNVADEESAVSSASGCEASTVVVDTGGTTFTCTATSAGGTSSSSVTIKRDTGAPSITSSRTPANANSWNNGPVTVTFECADALSGLAAGSPPAATTLRGEGADQSVGGRCIDAAGNSASATAARINIDLTPPVLTAMSSPPANANGWNDSSVTVSFTAVDALSGVDTVSAPVTLAAEGAAQLAAGSATDHAGNVASTNVAGINIDKTAPVVGCRATPRTLWPPDHRLVKVSLGVTVDDGLSGGAGFSLVAVTSNEPDTGRRGDMPGDIRRFAIGTPDTVGRLRAERWDKGAGRTYTIEYLAADKAGNSAPCSTVVTVPHDRRKR
jgi:hypothetical protein